MSERVDVVLVDDHPLLSHALQRELSGRGWAVAVGEITSVEALLAQVARLRPTLTVLDIAMPALGHGLRLIPSVRAGGSRVLMLTGSYDPPLWGECIEAGALAVVGKDEPLADILRTIELAVTGVPVRRARNQALLQVLDQTRQERGAALDPFEALTPSERRVLRALMEGRPVTAIAAADYVGVATVRSHVKAVLRKLAVGSQLEAVTMAYRAGWRPEEVSAAG